MRRLLDLFCGAGGAAMGYYRAGFDEIVGVDIRPQPNYPFGFICVDALEFLRHRSVIRLDYDAIHASPPCQDFLNLSRVNDVLGRVRTHERLIAATRDLLLETELPYVIENVADARPELRDPVRLCGTAFGLPLRRHRLFESNVPLGGIPCAHHRFTEPKYWTGWRPKGEHRLSTVVQVYGNAADKHEWPAAMGIDWMTDDELAEAIPPVYTEYIGTQLMAALADDEDEPEPIAA